LVLIASSSYCSLFEDGSVVQPFLRHVSWELPFPLDPLHRSLSERRLFVTSSFFSPPSLCDFPCGRAASLPMPLSPFFCNRFTLLFGNLLFHSLPCFGFRRPMPFLSFVFPCVAVPLLRLLAFFFSLKCLCLMCGSPLLQTVFFSFFTFLKRPYSEAHSIFLALPLPSSLLALL